MTPRNVCVVETCIARVLELEPSTRVGGQFGLQLSSRLAKRDAPGEDRSLALSMNHRAKSEKDGRYSRVVDRSHLPTA